MVRKFNLSSLFLTILSSLVIFAQSEIIGTENPSKKVIEKILRNEIKVEKFCVEDLRKIYEENLAIHEAWSTFNPNHRYGNSHDFGDFLGCKSFQFPTQYCMAQYFNNLNPPIQVPPATSLFQNQWTDLDVSFLGAICLPTSCSADDVREIFHAILNGSNLTLGQKIYCKTGLNGESSWNWRRFLLYSSIVVMTLFFSKIGIQKLRLDTILKDLINLKSKNPSTTYLNGIKAIVSIYTILVHVWYFRINFPFKSGENLLKFQTDFYSVILLSINCFMEIFLIIGGFLTAKCLAKDYEKFSTIPWIVKFYIKRFMRLVPAVLLIIALYITLNDEFSAPYSFGEDKQLYSRVVQQALSFDFRNINDLFLTYKWFILIYIKFTIAAPFVFMAIKSEKFGKFVMICIISVGIVCRHNNVFEFATIVAESNHQLRIVTFSRDNANFYIAVSYRFLSFFGGLIIEQYMNEKFKSQKITVKSIGIVISVSFLIQSLALFLWNDMKFVAILDNLTVPSFILLLYALYFDNGKVKKFLSHKFWTPISKMSLSVYLMTSYVQSGIHRRQIEPFEVESLFQFVLFWIDDFLRVLAPILLTYVLVEEPFARIGEAIADKL